MGNGQFERIYCNEYEVPFMEKKNDPHIWDSLFDENRRPLYTEFDPADLIDFHPFEIIGVPDGYRFDLGQGYEVELVHLPGHSAGMSGFIDHCNRILFSGDLTGILNKPADTPYWHLHTVEALRDGLLRLQPRLSEIVTRNNRISAADSRGDPEGSAELRPHQNDDPQRNTKDQLCKIHLSGKCGKIQPR